MGELALGKSPDGTKIRVQVQGSFDMDPEEAKRFAWAVLELAVEIEG